MLEKEYNRMIVQFFLPAFRQKVHFCRNNWDLVVSSKDPSTPGEANVLAADASMAIDLVHSAWPGAPVPAVQGRCNCPRSGYFHLAPGWFNRNFFAASRYGSIYPQAVTRIQHRSVQAKYLIQEVETDA
jgi:hypothetical protein